MENQGVKHDASEPQLHSNDTGHESVHQAASDEELLSHREPFGIDSSLDKVDSPTKRAWEPSGTWWKDMLYFVGPGE
jgi:hypothetical protein